MNKCSFIPPSLPPQGQTHPLSASLAEPVFDHESAVFFHELETFPEKSLLEWCRGPITGVRTCKINLTRGGGGGYVM